MAERPFIYDPSQQVAKNIEGVNRSVQNAWQPLIENKIRDYESISNDLANIDEIKRNLKGYHADILASRLGTLQGDLAKTIEKNGTINVASRAKVKADIEQVKNLYMKSQQAGPMLEEMLSRIKDNSAHINDVAGTRSDVIRKFSDPKSLLSGQSLSDELEDIYSKGLNVPAIGNARIYDLYKHVEKIKKPWINPDTKDLETIEYKPVDGLVFDEATGNLVPDMVKIQANAKGFFTTGEKYALKQNIGAAQALNANVEDVGMGLYLQSLKNASGFSRVINKTSDQLRTAAAKTVDAERKISPEFLQQEKEDRELDRTNKKSQIGSRETNTAYSGQRLGINQQQLENSQRNTDIREQEVNKPKSSGSSPVVRKTLSGNPIINMSIDDGDKKNVFNGVGVDKSGNFYLTKQQIVNGKTKSIVVKASQADVDRVINDLPPNKLNAVNNLKSTKNNPTPQVNLKTSSVPQKASTEMVQSASGKQISSVDFYKMSAIDRLNWKKNN